MADDLRFHRLAAHYQATAQRKGLPEALTQWIYASIKKVAKDERDRAVRIVDSYEDTGEIVEELMHDETEPEESTTEEDGGGDPPEG